MEAFLGQHQIKEVKGVEEKLHTCDFYVFIYSLHVLIKAFPRKNDRISFFIILEKQTKFWGSYLGFIWLYAVVDFYLNSMKSLCLPAFGCSS